MTVDRGFRARLRYRSDEFLSSGAGKQLLFLFILSMLIVLFHVLLAAIAGGAGPNAIGGEGFWEKFWFYFTRILDAGTMGGDEGTWGRIISTFDTIAGVVVAGLLISALAGNFQERLEAIKRGGSPVQEKGHFLILGWSEKIYSVVDQLSEANVDKGTIIVVVMAERDKIEMEERLRDKVVHLDRVKLVVRSGSSVSLVDLAKVAYDQAQAIVILVDDADVEDPNKADGRIIKTLLAIFNHPDGKAAIANIKVTAEVMQAVSREIAEIASDGRGQVITTNDIISKIILQTSRISGLSMVYDELLRFEGNEIHYSPHPQVTGRRFSDLLLDFSNGLLVGVAKKDGSGHTINPPLDHEIQADEDLLILAEDPKITFQPYQGPLSLATAPQPTPANDAKQAEHLLVLGWNPKIFPILTEFDNYVGAGSTVTMISTMPVEDRQRHLNEKVGELKNTALRHTVGEFTSRALMAYIQPHLYPTVMVLGDATDTKDAEDSDTRAIIALLLLRDFRRRNGVDTQEVCSEILNPKNRELAATTEINDIVISNEMVSMVIAQVTNEPRVRPVIEDLFQSEGSEIYLKPIGFYSPPGYPITFEQLILLAAKRGELALGYQQGKQGPGHKPEPLILNPKNRTLPLEFNQTARLVVLAEEDG